MGGYGSGRHRGAKSTVEGCHWIDANRWMREGILAADSRRRGRWVWSDPDTGEEHSSIVYDVSTSGDGTGILRLSYTLTRTQEALDYRVGLETTRPHLGGLRWWFTCPLVVDGRACRRRCGKLYLDGKYFGCRRCHDLTYTSCRESHRFDSMWRQMGERSWGCLPGWSSASCDGMRA